MRRVFRGVSPKIAESIAEKTGLYNAKKFELVLVAITFIIVTGIFYYSIYNTVNDDLKVAYNKCIAIKHFDINTTLPKIEGRELCGDVERMSFSTFKESHFSEFVRKEILFYSLPYVLVIIITAVIFMSIYARFYDKVEVFYDSTENKILSIKIGHKIYKGEGGLIDSFRVQSPKGLLARLKGSYALISFSTRYRIPDFPLFDKVLLPKKELESFLTFMSSFGNIKRYEECLDNDKNYDDLKDCNDIKYGFRILKEE